MTMRVSIANESNWRGENIEVKLGDGEWQTVEAASIHILNIHPALTERGETLTLQIRKATGDKEMFKNKNGVQTHPDAVIHWTNGDAMNG